MYTAHPSDQRPFSDFQARSSDIFVTTAPKCGTMWMLHILHQIRSNGDGEFKSLLEHIKWFGAPLKLTVEKLFVLYEKMPDPRIFKAHRTTDLIPDIDQVRLIMTTRDPRDACVSMYHHKCDLTKDRRVRFGISVPGSFAEHVNEWLQNGYWYTHMASWWQERNRPNLLILRYEDLVADLAKGVDQVSDFLGWSLDSVARNRVIEHCQFRWMAERRERFIYPWSDGLSFKPSGFIRKGKIGDYQSLMTPEQSKRILARARDVLPTECLSFIGI